MRSPRRPGGPARRRAPAATRRARRPRGEREQREAHHVDPLLPDDLAERRDRQQRRHHGELIGVDDPDRIGRVDAEIGGDRRQRGVGDGGVEGGEGDAGEHRGHRLPAPGRRQAFAAGGSVGVMSGRGGEGRGAAAPVLNVSRMRGWQAGRAQGFPAGARIAADRTARPRMSEHPGSPKDAPRARFDPHLPSREREPGALPHRRDVTRAGCLEGQSCPWPDRLRPAPALRDQNSHLPQPHDDIFRLVPPCHGSGSSSVKNAQTSSREVS